MQDVKQKPKEHWYIPEEDEKAKTTASKKESEEDGENGTNERREWPYGPFHPHVEKPRAKKSPGG